MSKVYKSKQKTHTDSIWGAPIKDPNPIVDLQDLMDIELNKKVYGVREALSLLDEEFKEFLPKKHSIKYFFKSYNQIFYELSKDNHRELMTKSMNYAYPDGYKNPRIIEKEDIIQELKDLQKEIDSTEREHFFFKNGGFMMDISFKDNPEGIFSSGGQVYYIQSSKKREIKDYQTYLNLKKRIRKKLGDIDDREFIIFVSALTLDGIPNGPDINVLKEVYLSSFEINIYPQTIEEYEPLEEKEGEYNTNQQKY